MSRRLPRLGFGLALPLILSGVAAAQPAPVAAPAPTPARPAPAAAAPVPATAPAARPAPAAPAAPVATPAPIGATPAAAPLANAPAAGLPAVAPANQLPPQAAAPDDAKKPPPKPDVPLTRTRSNVAILQALDKVTADTIRFEAPIGQPVRYKTLVFTVRACETTAADEPIQDYSAYVTIDSQSIPAAGKPVPPARQVFRGWMYAGSPGLNPLQHPVYDAWLIACRASAPVAPAPSK